MMKVSYAYLCVMNIAICKPVGVDKNYSKADARSWLENIEQFSVVTQENGGRPVISSVLDTQSRLVFHR